MSNKIVPQIYRSVIDEVIASIKPEFDEYGVSEDILAELQHKWESKVIASHVAEFEPPAQAPAAAPPPPHVQPTQHSYPQHPMHMIQTHPHYANPYAAHMAAVATAATTAPGQPQVKAEPVDTRYMLPSYTLPPLPGPNVTAARPQSCPHIQEQSSSAPARPMYAASAAQQQQQQPQRIPQVDGPSESSDDDESPSPPSTAFAPRTMHPSLPQPVTASQRQQTPVDSEAINSDLDDSDSDNEEEADEGGVGESDIVFCTYDKVARVKNKWKCVLKDGMIHVNGKDYLFAKCNGEFEW
ncbi:transcription factor IIA, alpha/beta subunit [Coprinellus micaceus]|uniref:Transcription factor IIA, alpha/beta subunit n=1 Tax=Coprinellus micaceus TaxID=71717 RepID=A0A4Y7TX28_COPMI|nr:transcription factor IIA, alpha/beta subunit [Coprinellus micaceus]